MELLKNSLILFAIYAAILFCLNAIFGFITKKKQKIALYFLKGTCQTVVSFVFLFIFLSQFDFFEKISKTLVLSSSLLVAVVGFACQKSLEDVVAGLMISIYKPFEVGDRINMPEKSISGYIEAISVRHTVVKTFTNSRLIIPNSVMNKEILENADMSDRRSSGYIDFSIDRMADIEKAEDIIRDEIAKNPHSLFTTLDDIGVYLNSIDRDFINLRASVLTSTVDDNFTACSDIRKVVIERFKKENIFSPKTIISLDKDI